MMKPKKSIVTVVLLLVATSADAAVSLTDVYKFDSNLTSQNGYTMQGQASSVSYTNGAAVIHSNVAEAGGYYFGAAPYNLTTNWAVQMDIKFQNTTGTAAKIFASNNNATNGLSLAATNSADGYTFALCSGNGWNGYSSTTRAATSNLQSTADFLKLSIVNRGSNIYMFAGDQQLSFGNGRDFLTVAETGLSSGQAVLGGFMLGFGPGGTNGISSSNDLTVGNLNVYSFAASDSLDDVKAAMGIPEPAAAALAVLGFAALGFRRRRIR
ncbi:PEP-CTERM sorting domain-containing protein [Akkermansia glycaniphila]|uniref:PEP-CTERM sorting domain-containing protein n=1 Tax=Akkermansia glycaniphila TaxID=1679444 RepID=UPI001C013052|nr:PEP-CTERM sorting domain-containing protein [Akkermansia glycaniphila]